MNKLQLNFNRNSNIFIQENAFENVVCEMAAILFWPQCVNINTIDDDGCQSTCVREKLWFRNWGKIKVLPLSICAKLFLAFYDIFYRNLGHNHGIV